MVTVVVRQIRWFRSCVAGSPHLPFSDVSEDPSFEEIAGTRVQMSNSWLTNPAGRSRTAADGQNRVSLQKAASESGSDRNVRGRKSGILISQDDARGQSRRTADGAGCRVEFVDLISNILMLLAGRSRPPREQQEAGKNASVSRLSACRRLGENS